jgi:hypothetical protein
MSDDTLSKIVLDRRNIGCPCKLSLMSMEIFLKLKNIK